MIFYATERDRFSFNVFLLQTIVVNGILASCHSSVSGEPMLQQTYFYALQVYYSWIDWALRFINLRIIGEEADVIFGGQFFADIFDLIVS